MRPAAPGSSDSGARVRRDGVYRALLSASVMSDPGSRPVASQAFLCFVLEAIICGLVSRTAQGARSPLSKFGAGDPSDFLVRTVTARRRRSPIGGAACSRGS
eukprot:757286-Hanusia_phi.AAC.1